MNMTLKNIVKEQIPPQAIMTVIFVIILAIGYCVWTQETSGTIALTAPAYGTRIYVDGKMAGMAKDVNEKMSFQYQEGKHSVIISRAGFLPWTEDLTLPAKATETLRPFFVRQDTKPTLIAPKVYNNGIISANPEYTDALTLLTGATTVKTTLLPYLASTDIKTARSAEFFPGRNDVLLVAVNDMIAAVDTGTRTPRNFQPVYKGTNPIFVISNDGALIIQDGSSIFRLVGYDR